jgi:hypothetical protein
MGTPLSFIVLSWVSAWTVQSMSDGKVHGDDAVGIVVDPLTRGDYSAAVEFTGASLNIVKSFLSRSCFTFCETWGTRARTKEKKIKGVVVFVPPPCPAPGLRAPIAAETRSTPLYLRRQERVMKTLFPWIVNDPRVRLPVEVGGLGYTGRGLAVSNSVRRRLAAALSKGVPDFADAEALVGKRPFREGGLYPRPIVPVAKSPSLLYRAMAMVEKIPYRMNSNIEVPLHMVVAWKAAMSVKTCAGLGGDTVKLKVSGRPERTRGRIFKGSDSPRISPLTRRGGVGAIRRFVLRVRNQPLMIHPVIASQILGRTQDSKQGR